MTADDDKEPVLVYVDGPWAYFADAVEGTYGDDWDDAPYEHNAGPPYSEFVRLRLAFEARDIDTPASVARNSPWSVEQINAGQVPWLADFMGGGRSSPVKIWAGVGVREFVRLIEETGGHVWVPMDGVPQEPPR